MSHDPNHGKAQPGVVYLVGAGPGDPDLLTRKAARLLETADVILHDGLVSQEILAIAAKSALITSVGKRCGKKRVTQAGIHSMMIASARRGLSVVRLKSGDPLVFGRAGEELQELRAAQIPFEIVPGIGAASAAAAAAGISMTDRRWASRVVFTSGHRSEDQKSTEYWKGLAEPGTTLVIYMPGPDLAGIAQELLSAGLAPATPCLAISHASLPGESSTLACLRDLDEVPPPAAPAILIVGEIARTAHQGVGVASIETPAEPASSRPHVWPSTGCGS